MIIPVTCCITPFIRYSPKVRELHEISPPFLVKHTFPFPAPCVAAQAQLQRGKRKRGNGVLRKHRFNEPSLGGPFSGFCGWSTNPPQRTPPRKKTLLRPVSFIGHWFTLIRQAIKPLFLEGVRYVGILKAILRQPPKKLPPFCSSL